MVEVPAGSVVGWQAGWQAVQWDHAAAGERRVTCGLGLLQLPLPSPCHRPPQVYSSRHGEHGQHPHEQHPHVQAGSLQPVGQLCLLQEPAVCCSNGVRAVPVHPRIPGDLQAVMSQAGDSSATQLGLFGLLRWQLGLLQQRCAHSTRTLRSSPQPAGRDGPYEWTPASDPLLHQRCQRMLSVHASCSGRRAGACCCGAGSSRFVSAAKR